MPSPNDLIGYDALQQEALRGVVRAALKVAAGKGLPGDHHFFITFKTTAPGVTLPKELLAHYPDEMRIALQHQYWDLAPGETFFAVTLKFGGQPKRLSIPYAAVTQFFDPHAQFMLQFSAPSPEAQAAPAPDGETAAPPDAQTPPAADGGEEPKVVSLDQFRKK
jgi:hypothetical protein